jgi:hypothetical protein
VARLHKQDRQAEEAAEKVLFVIPSARTEDSRRGEARDLLFFAIPKKQQIPRANTALRNDTLRVFPQRLKPVLPTLQRRWNSVPGAQCDCGLPADLLSGGYLNPELLRDCGEK